MKYLFRYIVILFFTVPCVSFSQDDFDFDNESFLEMEDIKTFNSTRIISGHSVETLPEKTFEMRIEHRFGDIAGDMGGYQTLFGFDNVADMRIALEYGFTDKLNTL